MDTRKIRLTTLLVVVGVVTLFQCRTSRSFPIYRLAIPNGLQVPDPCDPSGFTQGVGHINPEGGGPRNQFGMDFAAAGRTWTTDLCNKDSDGDGLSNGQELGDPDCTWTVGSQPSSTTGITHPGINNDSPGCDN